MRRSKVFTRVGGDGFYFVAQNLLQQGAFSWIGPTVPRATGSGGMVWPNARKTIGGLSCWGKTRGEIIRGILTRDIQLMSSVMHATAVGARRTIPTSDATAASKTFVIKKHFASAEIRR